MTILDFFMSIFFSQFQFFPSFIHFKSGILHTQCFSLMLNGSLKGYFPSLRGLHRGDSLSRRLFFIAQKILSRGLSVLMDNHADFRFMSLENFLIFIFFFLLIHLFFIVALGLPLKSFFMSLPIIRGVLVVQRYYVM